MSESPLPVPPRTAAPVPVAVRPASRAWLLWVLPVLLLLLGAGGFLAWRAGQPGSKNEYEYGDRKFRKTDPTLVKYHEVAQFDPGFQVLRRILIGREGRFLVAGDRAIRTFDAEGKQQAELKLEGEPSALALTPDGTLYAGFRDHVEVFDAAGKRTAVWPSWGEKAWVSALAVSDETVWVADSGARAVLKCSRAGEVVDRVGETNPAKSEDEGLVVYRCPLSLLVAPDATLWVANPGRRRVESYSPAGTPGRRWGVASPAIEGFCSCCNPAGLALFPDGRFVTAEKAIPRVKVYTAEGKFECVVAGAESFDEEVHALDVAVDPAGRILVLDPARRQVRVFVRKEGM